MGCDGTKWEKGWENEGLNLQGERKKRGIRISVNKQWALVIYPFLLPTLEGSFPFESCGMAWWVCWGGGKWKAVESSVEQWCKLLLFSQLFTSSFWFQHQQWPPSANPPPPTLYPSPHLPHASIPFSPLFHAFSCIPPTPLHESPSTYFSP